MSINGSWLKANGGNAIHGTNLGLSLPQNHYEQSCKQCVARLIRKIIPIWRTVMSYRRNCDIFKVWWRLTSNISRLGTWIWDVDWGPVPGSPWPLMAHMFWNAGSFWNAAFEMQTLDLVYITCFETQSHHLAVPQICKSLHSCGCWSERIWLLATLIRHIIPIWRTVMSYVLKRNCDIFKFWLCSTSNISKSTYNLYFLVHWIRYLSESGGSPFWDLQGCETSCLRINFELSNCRTKMN